MDATVVELSDVVKADEISVIIINGCIMTNFKLQQSDINQIKKFEGLSLRAYKPVPTERFYTIGYGHYGADVKANQVITEKEAESLLRKDLEKFEDYVNNLNVCKRYSEFASLTDFAFNLGTAALGRSTLLKYIRAKKPEQYIREEFGKWVNSKGMRLKGLVIRRQWEADRFYGKEA